MIGYKVCRKRKDGTYGPLFINQRERWEKGVVYTAGLHPQKGFAKREGFHILITLDRNHLAINEKWCKNRVICKVAFEYKDTVHKPKDQGGSMYLGSSMIILEEM